MDKLTENLYAKLKEIGVEDINTLPDEIKERIAEFDKLASSRGAIHINRKSGERNTWVINKLKREAKVILKEADDFLADSADPEPEPVKKPNPDPKKTNDPPPVKKTEPEPKKESKGVWGFFDW